MRDGLHIKALNIQHVTLTIIATLPVGKIVRINDFVNIYDITHGFKFPRIDQILISGTSTLAQLVHFSDFPKRTIEWSNSTIGQV